jgi:hypothetical protein
VRATWQIDPSPPVSEGPTLVRVTLRYDDGRPAEGANLRLEAHMAHPGMRPVTSDVVERSNGTYEARLRLSMAGDWVFVLTGELADGSRVNAEIQISAVRPMS